MFDLRYELNKLTDKAIMALAWLLPKRLVMWCAVRVGAHATTGQYSNQLVGELTFLEALKRWN